MMSSALLCGIVPESISDSNATPSNDSDVISVAESPSDATPSDGPSDDDGLIQTPSSKKVRVATSGKKRKAGKAKAGKATESQKKKWARQRLCVVGQAGHRNRYSQIPTLHFSFETGLTNSNLGVMTELMRKSGRFSKAVGNTQKKTSDHKGVGNTKSFGTCRYAVRG